MAPLPSRPSRRSQHNCVLGSGYSGTQKTLRRNPGRSGKERFQVHPSNSDGRAVIRKRLPRARFLSALLHGPLLADTDAARSLEVATDATQIQW